MIRSMLRLLLHRGAVGVGACIGLSIGIAACATNDSASLPAADEAADEAAGSSAGDGDQEAAGQQAGAGDGSDATGAGGAAAEVSFSRDVEPIIERSCASCHTAGGPGTKHLSMATAFDVQFAAAGVELALDTGFMPPWPAGGDSPPFREDWSLTDEDAGLLAAWIAAGAELDVPFDHPIEASTPVVDLAEPDQVLQPSGTYQGEAGQPDEYRCFVYDPELTEPNVLSAYQFIPDQTEVVHHAVGFLVSAESRDDLPPGALDGAVDGDGNGGWTCFGFQPASGSDLIIGWAPGQQPTRFPEGSGLAMDPGDVFVVQVHYHFEDDAPADASTLAVDWLDVPPSQARLVDVTTYAAPAEIPCRADETGPLCDRSAARRAAIDKYGQEGVLADLLLLACGQSPDDFAGMTDGIASSSCVLPARADGEIVRVLGHMHEIGASIKITLNPGEPDEQVLLDIPDWDFDWQLNYEPVDVIEVSGRDRLLLECTWDRGRRDPALEPAYVLWADGTDDEMCFATVATIESR